MGSSQDTWQRLDHLETEYTRLISENHKLRAILIGQGIEQSTVDQMLETSVDNCITFGKLQAEISIATIERLKCGLRCRKAEDIKPNQNQIERG